VQFDHVRSRHGEAPAAIAATLMALARGLAEPSPAAAAGRAREAVEVLEAAGEDATGERRFVARLRRSSGR